MQSNSRVIKFFDLNVSAHSTRRGQGVIDLPPRSLFEILTHLKAYILIDPSHRRNRAATETWHIAEIIFSQDNKKACLLINRSDRLAADQAISDPATSQFGVTAKQGNQGNASSSHVAINLVPVKPNTYLTVLEDTPGIGSKDIAMLISLALRRAVKANAEFFTVRDPSGDPAFNQLAQYKLTFRGHLSQSFKAELNAGVLNSIEISDFKQANDAFDAEGTMIEKKKVIYLKPLDKNRAAWDMVKSVCKTADANQYDEVRLLYTDDASFAKTVDLDVRTLQLVNEDRFVKKFRLENFANRLDTGFKVIHPEIKEKMFAHI